MTAPGDVEVTKALNDAVTGLGSPAAFDPARLRPALLQALAAGVGPRVGEFSERVEALLVAADEGIPTGMLMDVPAIDLGDRLEARELPAELIGWVLITWGKAVRLAQPSVEAGPVVNGGRRRLLIAAAAATVLVLVVAAVVVAGVLSRGGDDEATDARPAATATPSATPPPPPDVPGLLAHRGGGSEGYPFDTLAGMLAAAKAGFEIETDLRWTADDVPVLVNGAQVAPPMYCAQRYVIANTTWAQLRASCLTQASASAAGIGYPLPRLNQVLVPLAAVPDIDLFLELKVEQTAAQRTKLLDLLEARKMTDRTVLTSFLPAELASMRAAAKAAGAEVRLMQFVRDRAITPAQAQAAGLWAVALRQSELDAGYVGQLRGAGLKVVAWTPNSPTEWQAARDAGVDYLDTDKPRAYRRWADTN